jgi:hypothetical protein
VAVGAPSSGLPQRVVESGDDGLPALPVPTQVGEVCEAHSVMGVGEGDLTVRTVVPERVPGEVPLPVRRDHHTGAPVLVGRGASEDGASGAPRGPQLLGRLLGQQPDAVGLAVPIPLTPGSSARLPVSVKTRSRMSTPVPRSAARATQG